jgi:hypothetical protein
LAPFGEIVSSRMTSVFKRKGGRGDCDNTGTNDRIVRDSKFDMLHNALVKSEDGVGSPSLEIVAGQK